MTILINFISIHKIYLISLIFNLSKECNLIQTK